MPDPVRLGGVVAGEPIRTGWAPPVGPPPEGGALEQLTDVDGTTAAGPGSVLVKGDDGVWRPKSSIALSSWGDLVAFAETPPDPNTAPDNAVWVALGPDMKLYRKAL